MYPQQKPKHHATWSVAPSGVPRQNGTGKEQRWLLGFRTLRVLSESRPPHPLPPGPMPWGPWCAAYSLVTHITLVVSAVLPLLVGVSHSAIAVHVDVT